MILFSEKVQHFFDLHIKCFDNYKQQPLTFVGSVAYYLQEYIREIAKNEGLQLQEIVQSPIENLVKEQFLNKKPHQIGEVLWAQLGLNQRPLDYESSALTS